MSEREPEPETAEETSSSAAVSGADWAELTHECLVNIFSRLTAAHLWTGPMFVCRSWHRASTDPSLHSVFDLEPLFNSAAGSARWWLPEFERKMDSMLISAINWSNGSLTKISTRHCSDRAISLASERCLNLAFLSIKSCLNLTDKSLSRIAFRCPNLQELDVSCCYEISHESLALIGQNCPNLRMLKRNLMNWLNPSEHVGIVPNEYLNSCPQDGDVEAAVIGKYMTRLKYLAIRFSKLSARGLTSICDGCVELEYLDLSGCANLTGRDISNASDNLKSLKEIVKPNLYIPSSVFHTEMYGHWRLYDERFQTDVFRI
ncbi:F-box protein SKIP1-like [Punica granatum]|uniref:F-box domain-containing protein n=2 Tax=Punica granatum TaxID=22663 RepID=A0A218XZC4_PUNGR|nr:F-box protein SKIP1-like [Punica granatum]OWM89996.1 hypothetical protein CDL15_Pgr012633 [Punica granatum]PKI70219.1 hypothetical protein CRG98_009411 [Punica granatum]